MSSITKSIAFVLFFTGCATAAGLLGKPLNVPPEFQQKVRLQVSDKVAMHQAPKSTYDVGDLEAFHIQHTFPMIVEDAFREIFNEVDLVPVAEGPAIETSVPDVPAVFEVRMVDAANDNYFEGAQDYRGEVTLAVAMKSPRDTIFWQKAFRGEGYVHVDDQYSMGLGPQDALTEALRDAVNQMQDAILESPEVRNQLKHYQAVQAARQETEKKI